MTNEHEETARQRKTYALVRAIERISSDGGIPEAQIVDTIEALHDLEWAKLAVVANVRPPSTTTRAEVIRTLRARKATS